jgi:aminopeptidase N
MHPRTMTALTSLAVVVTLSGSLPLPVHGQVFGDPAVWRSAPIRSYHVENYRLKLHFSQAAGEVFGDEIITLRPLTAGFRRFYLDSSDLIIETVSLLDARGSVVALPSEQQGQRLWITLDREYDGASSLRVRVVYHGFPRFGLFFENPDADYPDRPREIWSQGESEFNHHWFPCWDYPNDMATSETITTVPEGQVVVSNGRLNSVTHSKGNATYDWVESVPHSSYLISVAVGPWQKVHDSYNGKAVDYYAPRGIGEATVRRAFHLTPDMIGFFSRLLIEYPYEKYAQVAVHDFLFGGQENVSATTLRESLVLQDAQAAADYPDTEVVAHELGQHWFGDYVQAGEWAEIWLNEGFATFLPALYTQYHDGNDAYRLQMKEYQDTAKTQDRQDYVRPIVDHHYTDDGMQMFDETTHEKGAVVLDMLRYVLDGSTAASQVGPREGRFFRALRHYLSQHAGQNATTQDLINAIRATTGQNLDWFFHEWVYRAGSPAYQVRTAYDPATKAETVTVTQTQQGKDVPSVFDMPLELAFHGKTGESFTARVRNDQAQQSFTIPLGFEPLWVDFDPHNYLEKTVDFPQSLSALAAAATGDPCMTARLSAAADLGNVPSPDAVAASAVLREVLANDPFHGVRIAAAAALAELRTSEARESLHEAMHQQDSRVRAAAASALGRLTTDPGSFAALTDALHRDPSYAVRAAAALSVGQSGMPTAFDHLQAERAANPEIHVASALEGALAATGDARAAMVLLSDARPGMPVRLRLSALAALPALREAVEREHAQELARLVSGALHDSYLPLEQVAEHLVVAFRLIQLEPELAANATDAPTLWQRTLSQRSLNQLQVAPPKVN